jgi:hypothetical protein
MQCKACLKEQADEEFPMRNDSSNRRRPYCYACAAEAQKSRYKNHRLTQPFKLRCSRARARARALGVPFDLTPEYLESIWTGVCPIFGVPISWSTDRTDEAAAELDRFIPAKGYVQGNVSFLSRKANRIKNNVSLEEIEFLAKWMKEWK